MGKELKMHAAKTAGPGLALMLAVAAAGPASASPATAASPAYADSFHGADANGDGNVSKNEYMKARTARFVKLDKNSDGVLNKEDFTGAASKPEKFQSFLDEADANKDGAVTKDELVKAPTPKFEKVDGNKDGLVSKAEIEMLSADMKMKRVAQ